MKRLAFLLGTTFLVTTVLFLGVTQAEVDDARAIRPAPVTPWETPNLASQDLAAVKLERHTFAAGDIGIQAAADHIVSQQCVPAGGFCWPHGSACCPSGPNNITGPIAIGVLRAYAITGDSAHLASAVAGGDYDLTSQYGNGEARFGTATPEFLYELSQVSGDPIYSNWTATEFFDELTAGTYGPSDYDTAGWILAVETARTGTWVNLRPWEFETLGLIADLIGNAGQKALFDQGVLDGLNTLDNTAPATVYSDLIGLAGGVRGLALNGTTTFPAIISPLHSGINGIDDLCELADKLVFYQNTDGSWNWHSDLFSLGGATEGDKDTQTTAYAVLALDDAQDEGCGGVDGYEAEIELARCWLWSMQDTTDDGGFLSYPGGSYNTEVEGEALSALVGGGVNQMTLEAVECQQDQDEIEAGTQIEVELWMRDLCQDVTGFQAFLEYNTGVLTYRGDLSSYTGTPFPIHIQPTASAEVTAGELRLDGSVTYDPPGAGTDLDAKLATLVFTATVDCDLVSVAWDLTQAFDSELSFQGVPLATELVDSPDILPDGSDPDIDSCPADITVTADANVGNGCTSAVVTYTDPGATDNCDGDPVVACVPASGSAFPVGPTTVTCTATDDCGNTDDCTFNVTVTPTNLIDVDITLAGSGAPVTRCIHFVTDDCDNTLDVELTFAAVGSDANSVDTIEIGCGNWTQLCAKDEQHTKWGTDLSLTLSGTKYVAAPITLLPGDNDNDGDVDINDITWLIFTFGNVFDDGGCPWDGTRDADFDNNGAVGSPDYSLLTPQWLTLSSCPCTSSSVFNEGWTWISTADLDPQVADRVDLNRDDVVDHQDVRIFELRNGLPNTLSTQMRSMTRSSR